MQADLSGLASDGAGRPSRPRRWAAQDGRSLAGVEGRRSGVLARGAEAWGVTTDVSPENRSEQFFPLISGSGG
jgi:hypothetical protein